MLRTIKNLLWVALLAAGMQTVWGYALLGPGIGGGTAGDSWETPTIGYGLPGDIGTPKNIGEEFRRNTPVMYYAYDWNFSGYFQTNGEVAVDGAVALMNAVTNVNSYSYDLNEWTLDSQQPNFTAQALGLSDLKSFALTYLTEQMGLAEPERYTWTLHDRVAIAIPGISCPLNMGYLVVQRNFDPVTAVYTPYVNGTLYSYLIGEDCGVALPNGVTEPFAVDRFASAFTAVAGLDVGLGHVNVNSYLEWNTAPAGGFYTGLTRDDVGGLRYMLSTNNIQYEDPAPGSLMWSVTTNLTSQITFPNTLAFGATNTFVTTNGGFYYFDGQEGYGDLTAFLESASTNAPALLQTLYPGVIVSSFSNTVVLSSNAQVVSYFTNVPGGVFGEPILVTATNYTPVGITIYYDTFANVFTNHYFKSSTSYIQTTTVGPIKGGSFYANNTTNVTTQAVVNTNFPSGDFYVLSMFNTNACSLDIIKPFYTNTTIITNIIATATNTTTVTTTTNTVSATVTLSQAVISYFTNYIYVISPVTCTTVTNATSWYQGVGQVQLVREPDLLDGLSGNFVQPVTNFYSMVAYNPTNNSLQTRYFERILTAPDITFSARDITAPNAPAGPLVAGYVQRSINFDANNISPQLAGPGTIVPQSIIYFNKVGDVFGNGPEIFAGVTLLSQEQQFGLLNWASFDATTNPPQVYPPSTTGLVNLENQLVISVSPAPGALPPGTNNFAYTPIDFTASGGTGSYTSWQVQSGTALPSGLSLSNTGVLSGTPTGATAGTYDFGIQVTDSSGRVVYFDYVIVIH